MESAATFASLPGSVRSFVAIELDRAVIRALERLQAALKKQVGDDVVRWVAPSGLHLTLKFLGNVPSTQISEIQARLERVAIRFEPFSFSCEGIGCFPNLTRPRVVWAGVKEPSGVLIALQEAVEAELSPLGYPAEERGFTPHLTLGRAGKSATSEQLRQLGKVVGEHEVGCIATMRVVALSLMRSELHASGAVYTCLVKIPLGSPEGSGHEP